MPSDGYDDYIRKIVDAAPPLTPEQRARLRELLSPVAITPPANQKRGPSLNGSTGSTRAAAGRRDGPRDFPQ